MRRILGWPRLGLMSVGMVLLIEGLFYSGMLKIPVLAVALRGLMTAIGNFDTCRRPLKMSAH
jgi:hypothetical protein